MKKNKSLKSKIICVSLSLAMTFISSIINANTIYASDNNYIYEISDNENIDFPVVNQLFNDFNSQIEKEKDKTEFIESLKYIEENEEIEEETILKELTIEEKIRLACEKYNVPYNIVLAISRLETGWFTSYAYTNLNNPGGLQYQGECMYFETIEDGIDKFVSNLKYNYFDLGLTSPETIGPKYCPTDTQHWINLVSELMYY